MFKCDCRRSTYLGGHLDERHLLEGATVSEPHEVVAFANCFGCVRAQTLRELNPTRDESETLSRSLQFVRNECFDEAIFPVRLISVHSLPNASELSGRESHKEAFHGNQITRLCRSAPVICSAIPGSFHRLWCRLRPPPDLILSVALPRCAKIDPVHRPTAVTTVVGIRVVVGIAFVFLSFAVFVAEIIASCKIESHSFLSVQLSDMCPAANQNAFVKRETYGRW